MALEVPRRPALTECKLGFSLEVIGELDPTEASIRHVPTPRLEVEQETRTVRIRARGLSLREEERREGVRATSLVVTARYRRGEGAIKQHYRYLVFLNAEEREGRGTLYAVRVPMGARAPEDPDACLEWLGRGGLQQGDFVLLPRKRLPPGACEVPRRDLRPWLARARESLKRTLAPGPVPAPEPIGAWQGRLGRHDPAEARLFQQGDRLFLLAERDTLVRHPEHAPLAVPAGLYEIVEDRASRYWRLAID